MKLTETQKELLNIIDSKTFEHATNIFKYDYLKVICNFKYFDASFNALLREGYFVAVQTNDFSNQFKRTNKIPNKLN
jgi:hypothetical protein